MNQLALENQILQVNHLIKIRFPSYLTSYKWSVEEKLERVRYEVPFPAILILVSCIERIQRTDLLMNLLEKIDIDVEQLQEFIDSLISNKLVFSKSCEYNQKAQKTSLLLNKWRENGWGEAGDYHWFAWDFPFLDYSKDGGKRSLELMATFHQAEPDIKRVKKYTDYLQQVGLPLPTEHPYGFKKDGLCSPENFLKIISLAFGKITNLSCPWSPISLIRRTSPSGGGRHPTEGYAIIRNIPGLESGWYHIQTDPPSLVFLNEDLNSVEFACTFPGFQDKKWCAMIVLSSIFERNMYRYREARTFRSIHMDAGHILGTIEMLGRELGLITQVTYNFSEKNILKVLNAHFLEEGVLACIGIGSDQSEDVES